MSTIDQRRKEYVLEVFADPTCVKDVIKALLHTIFFHRLFPPLSPHTNDLLDLTLPFISDNDLETLIDNRATALVRSIEQSATSTSSSHPRGRGSVVVSFFEKKRKKTYFSYKDEERCWETWCLDVTLAVTRYESDIPKIRRAQEKSLHKAAMKIFNIVNRDKEHIPPITTTEANPFPYSIAVNPRSNSGSVETGHGGWGGRMGIFAS